MNRIQIYHVGDDLLLFGHLPVRVEAVEFFRSGFLYYISGPAQPCWASEDQLSPLPQNLGPVAESASECESGV